MSYKSRNKPITDFLMSKGAGDPLQRNVRGFLPHEMNHKRLVEVAEGNDNDPDYLFVIKSSRTEFQEFILLQCKEIGLAVK
mmetsp:Transcript_33912/g.33020  ORF Transcript_33912/g.33020 Transcript_33912/m.33020 type:complete len:81 (-) Transcript_33912:2397-2639(-)